MRTPDKPSVAELDELSPEAATELRSRGRSPPLGIRTLASLAYRDFVFLWLGQITHAFALWLEQTARPLLILALTGSAVHLGGVILARTVPAVALGLVAGVVADSFNRRLVLIITKVIVLGLSAIFVFLVVTNSIEVWHIYLFSVLRGGTMAFDQPARRAMIPAIVPAHLVTNAMALTMGGMRIVGAASAGLLMEYYGIAAPFVVIVFAYIGAVIFTWMLRTPDHQREGYQGVRRMGGDLVEGLKFAWNTGAVRGVLIVGLGYFAFGMAFMQVFAPLFATQVLDIGESGYGFLVSVMGIGGLAGSIILATANPTKGRGVLMLGLMGFLLILFPLSTYLSISFLPFVMMALLGLGQSGLMPLINTMLIEQAPENMRGRVMGLLSLDRAVTALGGFIAGMLAAAVGAQVAQIIFGICCIIVSAGMFIAYPTVRRMQ